MLRWGHRLDFDQGHLLTLVLLGACQPSPSTPPDAARDRAALADPPVETLPTSSSSAADDEASTREATLPSTARSCEALAGHRHLVIVTWPSTLRRQLARADTRTHGGLLVLARVDCGFALLPECRVPGRYNYVHSPLSFVPTELPLADIDELWANLPDLAAREPREWSGPYLIAVQAAGTLRAATWDPSAATLEGQCEGATHVLDTIELGAGWLARGSYVEPNGPADIDEVLVEFGDPSRCENRYEDKHQPKGCDEAWAISLIALDDDGERDACPGPTGYDGLLCSSPGRMNHCGLEPADRRCNHARGDEPRLRELLGF